MNTKNKIKLLKALYTANKAKDFDCDFDALFRLAGFKNQEQGTKEILKTLTHRQCVLFAYNCSKSVVCFLKPKSKIEQKAKACLNLSKQWLANPESVSKKKLNAAAYAAADAANAAYAATNAANAAANAAYATANAAYATYAADNAAYVVRCASRANPNKPEQAKKNLEILLGVL